MILGVQIIGVLFGLFMIYLTFLYKKRGEIDQKESAFWFLVWIAFILVSIFPNFLVPLAERLSFSRVMDMLVILGFVFVIGISFYNYHTLRKTQKKVEEMVRKFAFKGAK